MVSEMPTPDPNYVALFPIQEVIIDKDTGLPLSAGVVTFYEDNDRTVLKPIYEQVQNPDNTYSFAEINNPITLTSVGTFADDSGNDIIPFLYPYTGLPSDPVRGALDLYYITVYAAIPPVGTGALQFTREAWPPNVQDNSGAEDQPFTANELSNPQFVEVLFDPLVGLTFSVTGSGTVSPIAPDWDIVTNGSGSITVNQVAITDTTAISNPPYVLDITSSGITSPLVLRQRIVNSPRLLANGIVAGYLVASSQDSVAHPLTLSYVPSNSPTGSSYQIATGSSVASGVFTPVFGSVAISGVLNTDSAITGYIDIQLTIPTGAHVQVSSFQLVGVPSLQDQPAFIQLSTPRQIDQLFHYWKPKLEYKPIPSYTIGWDFRFNPTQALGSSVSAAALGANMSRYIADQTIAFEAVSNVLSYTFNTSSGLIIASSSSSQCAIIQYLNAASAKKLLSNSMCVHFRAGTSSGTIGATVNLYWTTDASLPVLTSASGTTATGNSLVSAMTAGVPTIGHGTWIKVGRGDLGDAAITIPDRTADFSISGWQPDGTGATDATFFAIVIGFSAIVSPQAVGINHCSLCSGDIPTPPAPLSSSQTLQALRAYYEMSYNIGDIPGNTISPVGYSITAPQCASANGGTLTGYAATFSFNYSVTKRASPHVVFFNGSNTVNVIDFLLYGNTSGTSGSPSSVSASPWSLVPSENICQMIVAQSYVTSIVTLSTATAGLRYTAYVQFNYVADARFGVV